MVPSPGMIAVNGPNSNAGGQSKQSSEPMMATMTTTATTTVLGSMAALDQTKGARQTIGSVAVPVSNTNNSPATVPMAGLQSVPTPAFLPMAILKCRANSSQPFDERRFPLEVPAKVGRAVAKCRPSEDNAIFDCKVLSRNHALLWFEDGKFYLQDTKSSNGTFINNKRLSQANEESMPAEICSGDMVQFGVDVMENNKKVTHGCIIASIKLLLPDGTEAIREKELIDHRHPHHHSSPSGAGQQDLAFVSTAELHQLSKLLNEAVHREQILENKLATLQRVVTSAQEAADAGWKSLVEEDRLLSRIETLQNRLEVCLNAKSASSDGADNANAVNGLRDEIFKLQEDKEKYECAAKEAIQRALEQKLLVMTRLHELENSVASTEDECRRLKIEADNSHKEVASLAQKIDELMKQIDEGNAKLRKAEDFQEEMAAIAKKEKRDLQTRISELTLQEVKLNNMLEELRLKNEAAQKTIEQLKLQLVVARQERVIRQGESQEVDLLSNSDEVRLEKLQRQLECSHVTAAELTAQIEMIKKEQNEKEEEKDDALNTTPMVLRRGSEGQVNSAPMIIRRNSEGQIDDKQTLQLASMPLDLHSLANSDLYEGQQNKPVICNGGVGDVHPSNLNVDSIFFASETPDQKRVAEVASVSVQVSSSTSADQTIVNSSINLSTSTSSSHTSEIDHLKDLLENISREKIAIEEENVRVTADLEQSTQTLRKTEEEVNNIHVHMNTVKMKLSERSEEVEVLRSHYNEMVLKYKETESLVQLKDQEISSLKGLLEEEKKVQTKYCSSLDQTRKQLVEAQQTAKQSLAEAELLRKKVYSVNEELRSSRSNLIENAEHDRLKNECAALQQKIRTLETQLGTTKDDNTKLCHDLEALRMVYEELKAVKDQMEARGDSYWQEKITEAIERGDVSQRKVTSLEEENAELKMKLDEYTKKNEWLTGELKTSKEDYELVSYQTKIASGCAIIPLIMLLVAVIVAYYPSVSNVTGTAGT